MDPTSQDVQADVTRRYKAAATTVLGLIVATILLAVLAYVAGPYLPEEPQNPQLNYAVRILILILGLGAIVWRRTKFAPLRLQALAGLHGTPGLVRTLEKTTLQIAVLAIAIAVLGFVITLVNGSQIYTYMSCAVALLILVFYFPTKSSWLRTVARFTENNEPPPPPDTQT